MRRRRPDLLLPLLAVVLAMALVPGLPGAAEEAISGEAAAQKTADVLSLP